MSVISMKQLLEAGVHFGHQTRRWNPKASSIEGPIASFVSGYSLLIACAIMWDVHDSAALC